MRIALHGRKFSKPSIPFVKKVISQMKANNGEIVITSICSEANIDEEELNLVEFEKVESKSDLQSVEYIFSLGGDGTFLETVWIIGDLEIPILGINLGTLGFLATTSKIDIASALSLFFQKQFTFDCRALIRLDGKGGNNIFKRENFALNEVAILKKDTSSMIVIHCYIDDQFVNTYWADGVMVSTPTGSTGYSLSCGGPLVLPQSDSLIITPVSPHNLNVRPMIISSSSEISFKIEGKGRQFLASLDSRSYTLANPMTLWVRKENFRVKLIKLKDSNFFETLRAKLNWGRDARN